MLSLFFPLQILKVGFIYIVKFAVLEVRKIAISVLKEICTSYINQILLIKVWWKSTEACRIRRDNKMHNRAQTAGTHFSTINFICKKKETFRRFFQADGKNWFDISTAVRVKVLNNETF